MSTPKEQIIGVAQSDASVKSTERANRTWEKQYRAFGLPRNTVTAIISIGIITAFVLSTMGVGAAVATSSLAPLAGVAFNHYVNKGKIGG